MADRSPSFRPAGVPNPVKIGAAGLVGLVVLPQRWWPRCPVHYLTGGFCPGCGGQRAVRALVSGQFRSAARYNPLLFALPILLLALRTLQGARWEEAGRRGLIVLSIIAVVAFTVARNLPESRWAPPNRV